jgi:hypothetical protein
LMILWLVSSENGYHLEMSPGRTDKGQTCEVGGNKEFTHCVAHLFFCQNSTKRLSRFHQNYFFQI